MNAARENTIDWARVRTEFPLLTREVHGKPLVYLDSANTGQKPASVIDAVDDFYRRHNANVSRAVHTLGTEATDAYEGARLNGPADRGLSPVVQQVPPEPANAQQRPSLRM